jgi:hypothetical protein
MGHLSPPQALSSVLATNVDALRKQAPAMEPAMEE